MDPVFDVLVLVRWVHFCAMFVLFGGSVFWAYAPDDGTEAAAWRWTLRSLKIAAPLALVSGAGWLAATIVDMTGLEGLRDPDTLHAFFLETLFGPIEAARMALLSVVAILAVAPMPDRRRVAAMAVASALLLVSQAWLGHAAEGGVSWYGAMMIAAYAAHVLAAAAWLGGLAPLLVSVVALRRKAAPPGACLALLSRYSLMATLAVVLIVASGIANAAFRVGGHFGAFAGTSYGDLLIVKVALVGLILGFAAYNRLLAMPRLLLLDRGDAGRGNGIMVSIGCEIALGLLVLLVAAGLGITPPPA